MPSPYVAEAWKRLERIKKLCDELEEARDDNRKYRRLIESIRTEAESFTKTFATHDPKA